MSLTTDQGGNACIHRKCRVGTIKLSTDATPDEEALDISGAAWGSIEIPATIASVTLTFYGCMTKDGTFLPLTDRNGTAVTLTVAQPKIYELPPVVFTVPYLRIKSNADDGESVSLCLKG